jgi:adenylylsulfate reductase subunit B
MRTLHHWVIAFACFATRKKIKFRNGEKDLNLIAPITTKPWGESIPDLKKEKAPTQEQKDSQLLYSEPKYIRMDDGDIHTFESNGLKMKQGVAY